MSHVRRFANRSFLENVRSLGQELVECAVARKAEERNTQWSFLTLHIMITFMD